MDAFPIKYGIIISEFRSPDAMQTGNDIVGLMVFPFFTAGAGFSDRFRVDQRERSRLHGPAGQQVCACSSL